MLLQAHSSPLPSSLPAPFPGDLASAPGSPRPKLTLLASAPCAVPRVLRELVGKQPGVGGVVVVVDADPTRREASARRLWRFLAQRGTRGWVVVATADARRALPGSSVVLALPNDRPRAVVAPLGRPASSQPSQKRLSPGRRPGAAARAPGPRFPAPLRRACAELCPEAVLLIDSPGRPRRSV